MAASCVIQHINPAGGHNNPAYTNVIAVSGTYKTVFIGGQNSVDSTGAIVGKGDLRAQVQQVLANVQAALAAAGADFHHVVKWNLYVLQGQDLRIGFEVFRKVWGNRPNPPTITGVFVPGLARPELLLEMDAIAIVPDQDQAA